MITERASRPHLERYQYDFEYCRYSKGWAQVDTWEDAPYFGTWANPFKLVIVTFAEGDETTQEAESEEEFVQAIHDLVKWHRKHSKFHGIDPAFQDRQVKRWTELGLQEYLH
jgi:hypothetical protein